MNRKIFLLTLCFLIALIPMLFGAGNNRATIDTKDSAITYDPNARVNLKPSSEPAHINTGRGFGDILMTIDLAAIGVPAVGYAGAGITWDGTYLYYVNQNDQKIYVIDPTGPSVVTSWSTGLSGPWGCGSEINIWITDYTVSNIYEYNWGGTPTGNSFYCGMGGASWMGDASEWWADGEIWILAVGGTNRAYKFSVPGGTYLADIGDPAWTYTSQRGFTYDPHNDKFFVGGWNSDMVWEINSDGTPTGRQFYFNAIAGLAYDWQSTLHPTPVLWLTTSASYNYIYMVDADNPQPVFEIVWDFEDGWQGWTHTNGLSFPGGWEPYDATYRSGWGYQCPSSDDSSMCIDSDLYFGATMDTALSPFLVPLPGIEWLDYGFFYNDLATHFDYFEVGIKYFDGSTWTVAPLKTYDSDYNGDWESVDVSAYSTYDLIQVYFYYHAPGWDYYAAFDNVSLGFGVRPAEHDVGCDQITSPPAGTTLPGDYDVIGNINLFGDFIETFDATATVYDTLAGWIVVFKTTLTLTNFSPGAESLVNFGMVTLEDNKVYYTEIYTELVGDEHPENDTTTATCETSSQLWKIYADMPQASYYNAAVYTDVTATPTVYSVGGDPTYTSIFEFDCNTETWSTSSATLNHQARRLAAAVVDGKIYAIGGMPGSGSTALNYCQEYDPVAGTVTDKTAMPTARQFLGAVAWNDTLIYVMGGQSGSSYYSTIEIYDPANDAWTTATPLPEANRSFACGIAGDIIYVTGGYSGSGYRTATRIGVIDPTNPQSITWSSGPDIPIGSSGTPGRSRVQGACVDKGTGWVFYFTGGDDHGGSYPAYDTWYYDPNDALWHQDLDKPTPISNSQCAVYVPILDQGTFFCCGGYNTATGSGTAATEGLINLTPPTGIAEEPDETATLVFGLSKIAPNPVKDGATVSYTTTRKGPVSLKVYDCAGRLVRTLIDRNESAGHKTVYWDGKDANHRSVAAGVYFYRLVAEEKTSTKKMVVVR